jgi:hypothetical protein
MPQPMNKPNHSSAPGSDPAVTVTLKSQKNPPLDLSLPATSLNTSVLDLKQKIAQEVGLESTEKIRLLYKKKPAGDAKSIKDVIGEEKSSTVDFSVMIMGGVPEKAAVEASLPPASAPAPAAEDTKMEDAPVAQGESGMSVMHSADFWSDLQGFLEQRVRDQAVAEKAVKLFEAAWKEKAGST